MTTTEGPAATRCDVCQRQDCATLGFGNPAHKREHHENWARHWRLGYERLRAQLTEAQEAARDHSSELHATVPSLRARLVEVERELAEEARLRVKDCEDRNQQKRRGDLNWALVEDEKKARQAAESRALAAERERDHARRVLSREVRESLDALGAERDRALAAEARLSEVEGALRRYGWHTDGCKHNEVAACDCGFDAALSGSPPISGAGEAAEWLIWSFEHDSWWAPNERGYARDINAAGRYTRAHAREIVHNANLGCTIRNEAMVLAPEAAPISDPDSSQKGEP